MTRFHSTAFLWAGAFAFGLLSFAPWAESSVAAIASLDEAVPVTQISILAHGQPTTLIAEGGRFHLTDLWITRDENNTPVLADTDRVWLERAGNGVREVLFDVFLRDLPNPLHFQTGLVVAEGESLRIQYSFAVPGQNRATRRVLVSGLRFPRSNED